MTKELELSRSQILAYRRRVTALDERLPRGEAALRRVAQAGLQDSMPRAALLSIHARMAGAEADSWDDPALVQIWGPRYNVYAIAKEDLAVFTLGRLPEEARPLARARDVASRLAAALDGARLSHEEAARATGVSDPNRLRYAAPTGTLLIRWDGARQADLWNVPAPDMDPQEARLELARRYLQVFGPTTPAAFAKWAGVSAASARARFETLADALLPVRTPIGDAWILAEDEPLFRAPEGPTAAARLLPSGDTWYLLHDADRALLVPDERRRGELWTSRVWPGALLVDGDVAGTWRRAQHVLSIQPWQRPTAAQRAAVEAEAAALPLPGLDRPMDVRWEED